jgi:DNA polymerase-3 subunit delta'
MEDGCACRSCTSIAGGHPDLLCVGRGDKILVEDIDGVLDFVSRAPLISNTKVIVMDDAGVISYEASNRLLKTLEESSFTFFLVTSELSSIIPTIKSRCVKVSFDALSQDDMINILWKKMGFDLPQARVLGWLGAASSIDIFSNAGSYLKYRDMSFEFMGLLKSSDFTNVWDFIDKIPRDDLTLFVDMLVLTLTDVLLLSYSIDSIINADRRSDLQKMSKTINQKSLIFVLSVLSQIKKNCYLNINLNLALKSALIKVCVVI